MDSTPKRELIRRDSQNTMNNMDSGASKGTADSNKNLGVLFTGNLEKIIFGTISKTQRTRFVVLTHESFHWFKKADGTNHLFGEERGHVSLGNISGVRVLDEDESTFELMSADLNKRYFKCRDKSECIQWVSAIRSALKNYTQSKQNKRRKSVYNSENQKYITDDENVEKKDEVTVSLVALKSIANDIETVITHKPEWGRIIFLRDVRKGDELLITTSNGGKVVLSSEVLNDKAYDHKSFESAIKNVPLASSLKMIVEEVINVEELHEKQGAVKRSWKIWAKFNEKVLAVALSDSSITESIMLTLMVGLTATQLLVLGEVTKSNLLFFTVSFILAVHTFIKVGRSLRSFDKLDAKTAKHSYQIRIFEHQYSSPDAPVMQKEDEIPQRFINGCEGDLREARRRWEITRKWREEEKIDTILTSEQPHFHTIKTLYPHYVCGRDRLGQPVYYERPGEIELPQLKARGIGLDQVLRHWLFVTEYQWNIIAPDHLAKSIAVIDMGSVGFADITGEPLEFVRKSIGIANLHYPERAFMVYLVNVPKWFSWLWGMLKPLVHENTQKKIRILSKKEVFDGLREFIDDDQIPVYYGGKYAFGDPNDPKYLDSARFHSADEKRLATFVDNLNKRIAEGKTPTMEEVLAGGALFESNDTTVSEPPPGSLTPPPNSKLTSNELSRLNTNSSSSSTNNHSHNEINSPGGAQSVISALSRDYSDDNMSTARTESKDTATLKSKSSFFKRFTSKKSKSSLGDHDRDDWSVSSTKSLPVPPPNSTKK